jgi:hypothetical protein
MNLSYTKSIADLNVVTAKQVIVVSLDVDFYLVVQSGNKITKRLCKKKLLSNNQSTECLDKGFETTDHGYCR